VVKFAGIKNPYKVGKYGVDDNSKIIQRYRYIHEELMRICSGQLPLREDWDLKAALGRHIYEDAEAADQFRTRVTQLRTTAAKLNKDPDASLTLLMEELIHAENDLELLVGIYGVIKPALLETYKVHISETQQIVDQPTIRILRPVIMDLEEQIAWGNEMITTIKQEGIYPDNAKEFEQKITSFLEAAGGIDGQVKKSPQIPLRWRSHEPFKLPMKSARDPRKMGPVTHARTSVANPPKDEVGNSLVSKMRVRQEEMTAAELIAGVLFSQKNMPWEFYHELARHLWDEVRHSLFGQAALEAEGYDWMSRPQYTSDYDVNAQKIPSAQYTWLAIGIEEGAMKRPGKRGEFEFCRDEAKHPLMTQFQDYDWADEVVHATFGRKWSPDLIGEDIEFVRQVAQKELDHFWKEVSSAQQKWEETNKK
jgi:hypothetical protein